LRENLKKLYKKSYHVAQLFVYCALSQLFVYCALSYGSN